MNVVALSQNTSPNRAHLRAEGSTSQLLFGTSESSASLLWSFGATLRKIGVPWARARPSHPTWSDTKMATRWQEVSTARRHWTKRWFTSWVRRTNVNHARFHHATHSSTRLLHATENGAPYETCKFLISGIPHLIFLDHGWPGVTALESKTGEGGTTVVHNKMVVR